MKDAKRFCCRMLIGASALGFSFCAQAGSPQLTNLLPIAGQRGQTVEVKFYGERLVDATGVLFHGQGIRADEVAIKDKQLTARFVIDADASIGEHALRVVTSSGVSELITFRVVDRPIVRENEEQPGTLAQPQALAMGSTVMGRTLPEEVDFYAVELAQGQRLSVQVDGMCVGRGFTDSYLSVIGPDGRTLISCDDTPLFRQDPYVSLIAQQAGRYVISLRDSGYEGGENNRYLMHVGSFVRPAAVFPLGGRPGEQVTLRFIGDLSGEFTQSVTLPAQTDNRFFVVPERDGLAAPSGHAFRVNDLLNILEDTQAPNDKIEQLGSEVPAYDVPVALNGVIEKPGDMDYYKLRLKKGQAVNFRTYAKSMGSPLDPVINLYTLKDGKHIQGNDDQNGLDSQLSYTVPEDGEYAIRIRDHLNRSGADYVYRIEATLAQPTLSTSITRYDRNRPQDRQAIAVPQGNRAAALMSIDRESVNGDLTPEIAGLPAGLSFVGLGPSDQGNMMPVVFEANADAPLGARLVDIEAVSLPKREGDTPVRGGITQTIPLVMGNPNQTEYYLTTLDAMPVAVTHAVPLSIEVIEPKAPLVRNGKLRLKAELVRGEGYDKRVRLSMLWRPQGLGATSQVQLEKDQVEAYFDLDATNATPTRRWPMVVVAQADTAEGPVWVSSQLFELAVEEPFVTGSIGMTKCERGGEVDITVKLEHPRDWQGEGQMTLLGLPGGCKADPVKVQPGQSEAVFHVVVPEDAPSGQHKSLVCELTIQVNGESVIHRFGQGGTLRIDKLRKPNNAQARSDGGQ